MRFWFFESYMTKIIWAKYATCREILWRHAARSLAATALTVSLSVPVSAYDTHLPYNLAKNPTGSLSANTPVAKPNRPVDQDSKGLQKQANASNEPFSSAISRQFLRAGQELMKQQDWNAAIEDIHFAIYIDPSNSAAFDSLNDCLKSAGSVHGVNTTEPNSSQTRTELAREYELDNNFPDAIAEYRACVRILDSGAAHAHLGRALVKQGKTIPGLSVDGYRELTAAVRQTWPTDQTEELGQTHLFIADMLSEWAIKARDRKATQIAIARLKNAAIEYKRAGIFLQNSGDTDAGNAAFARLLEVVRELDRLENETTPDGT